MGEKLRVEVILLLKRLISSITFFAATASHVNEKQAFLLRYLLCNFLSVNIVCMCCVLCNVQSKLAVMSGNFKSVLEVRTEVSDSYWT